MFDQVYHRRRVLVTGHTGFKGSWLCAWLQKLGAELCGVALPLATDPVHSELLQLDMRSEMCDIRDLAKLQEIFHSFQPEIVFHLAAQPIVRLSYDRPVETFDCNVMGTVKVLEACRHTNSVRAIVAISSDKCYENQESLRGYRETDPMGGYDPYSASKGCTELVASSYRRSFFNNAQYGNTHHTLLATGRAGNVIGGGDWAPDRLVPDLMRAAGKHQVSEIRSPHAVRPWQHVLEPLSGYLRLGAKLFQGDVTSAAGWNFGPDDRSVITVEKAAQALADHWSDIKYQVNPPTAAPHEANLLRLDCAKARTKLQWHSVWSPEETFAATAKWYQNYYQDGSLLTAQQIDEYMNNAIERNLAWTL